MTYIFNFTVYTMRKNSVLQAITLRLHYKDYLADAEYGTKLRLF